MKNIKFSILPALVFILLSCESSSNHIKDFSEHGARHSAEEFYGLLIHNRGTEYVDNMSGAQQMDSCMRNQMYDLIEQFLTQEKELRQGILKADATECSINDSTALVLLNLQYGNNTHEQVSLPLIYTRGRWYIK